MDEARREVSVILVCAHLMMMGIQPDSVDAQLKKMIVGQAAKPGGTVEHRVNQLSRTRARR